MRADKCRILAVDDNHVNRLLIKRMLCDSGMEIDTAKNGKEAVEMAAKEDYDLIIMDLQMPVMDGFDATTSIRKNAFEKPIVALSANINNDSIRKSKEVGMNDFLEKPFQKHQLITFIQKWINR